MMLIELSETTKLIGFQRYSVVTLVTEVCIRMKKVVKSSA